MVETEIILDRFTRVAPLGLRFWDPLTQRLVSDGLQVSAVPRVSGVYQGQPISATLNRSDVFVFHHLPGKNAREIEGGEGDQQYWQNLPPAREYIVTVKDTLRRFLPFQTSVFAPQKGFYSWACASSHPVPALPGQPAGTIPLYAAPRRPPVSGLAVLRADLLSGEKSPAAWTMLEVYYQGELLGRSLADKEGHTVLCFPYPRLTELSPYQTHPSLAQESWQIDLGVFHAPAAVFPDPPDLCALLAQPAASPLETLSPDTILEQITLHFGQEIVLKTQNRSELWIVS